MALHQTNRLINLGEFGPYRQSERKPMYRAFAEELVKNDKAYYAFDTAEELDNIRQMAKDAGNVNWQYNYVTRASMKNSLTLPKAEVDKRLAAGEPHVIRMKMPRNEEVKFEDKIRGWVSVNTNNLDDKVLFKADGMPTYHLANIVDDHTMEITHVIRGEEWLPSAPLHVMLYDAFGWDRPEFAHLPLLLRPDGNGKLSKRDGDRLGFPVFPINWENKANGETASGYRERGFFPQAFVNMLAFLGWNPGTDQEIFSLEELVNAFTLEKVGKSGARFDFEKAKWFNQQYLRAKSNEELADIMKPFVEEAGFHMADEKLAMVAGLMSERATFPQDLFENGRYLFEAPTQYDEKTHKKKWKEDSAGYVKAVGDIFAGLSDFSSSSVEAAFKNYLTENELGFGKVGPVLRLAITGMGMGPSLFDICEIIGQDEVVSRINKALEVL